MTEIIRTIREPLVATYYQATFLLQQKPLQGGP